jgi:hypothetical protein
MKTILTIVAFVIIIVALWTAVRPIVAPQPLPGSTTPNAVCLGTVCGPVSSFIRVTVPVVGEAIHSPITLTGVAAGAWFSEGSFPVELFNEQNQLIGTALATAGGDWSQRGSVPFSATMAYTPQLPGHKGTLVFYASNETEGKRAVALKVPVVVE